MVKNSQQDQDEDDASDLVSVLVNLEKVLDAIVEASDGLTAEWSGRFAEVDFVKTLNLERERAMSLVFLFKSVIEHEDLMLAESGIDSTLSSYPVQPDQLAKWSSGKSAAELWGFQATATIVAFEELLAAMENSGAPRRFEFVRGERPNIEFDPLRTAALTATGRLLIELLSENAETFEELTGRDLSGAGVKVDSSWQDRALTRGLFGSGLLGLPQAQVLYSLRLIKSSNMKLSETDQRLIHAAEAELLRWIEGEETSIGLSLLLADALTNILRAATR